MLKFDYSIPTKIHFGKGRIQILARTIKQYGSRVLLTYGGGSIKKNGVYDKIVEILNNNDIPFFELGGIDPNPRLSSVKDGIKICKENNIDFVLAIGGGSVIDCSKIIAAGCYYENDPWDFFTGKARIKEALPIGTILTLAATGSEMNGNAVISNLETEEKLPTAGEVLKPKFSILDPSYTATVPVKQTAAGTVDIMSHAFEQYFSPTEGAFLQDRLAEAVIKTCIKYGPIAINNPEDYEARANLMWASSIALNGLLTYGKFTDWATHGIEHELSAIYDITHGIGLAILTPRWMEYVLDESTVDKFVEYGVNVWGIPMEENKFNTAKKAIEKTKEFFIQLGIPMTLQEVGINEERLEEMAEKATKFRPLGSFKRLKKDDVLQIFKASLK
ncbi:iron-containing alcohol dehydrogenase [Clostridium ganghwense]|uniref:Iron-containing alcohol dehydrogenase n=1 Tax=Clostridium ganghwense TaxID=312089 RepID=A0ABT4CS26_9CLOT|nr:iron-containing alcohol dehydrogenase [Clostridium ganghwense]MCY6371871.1 iron-containing alcohol dehydrogenase [Clostridium ganghwense]